jgi:hypothetical protein
VTKRKRGTLQPAVSAHKLVWVISQKINLLYDASLALAITSASTSDPSLVFAEMLVRLIV